MILKFDKPEDKIRIIDDIRKLDGYKNYAAEKIRRRENPPYEFDLPEFPKWCDRSYTYRNLRMNVYRLECDCGKQKKLPEEFYGKRNVKRVCRHLFVKLQSPLFEKFLDDLSVMIIKAHLYHGEKVLFYKEWKKAKFYYGAGKFGDWINVYAAHEDGRWLRYSYHPIEKRWSYNSKPKDAEIILIVLDGAKENLEFYLKRAGG